MRIDHDINLLGVIPRLRILVSVSLNADMLIDDHKFYYQQKSVLEQSGDLNDSPEADEVVEMNEKSENDQISILTVTASLLEFVMYWLYLILSDIIEDMQVFLFFVVQAAVQLVANHLISPSLER